jgi:hypothetical protein
MPMERLPGIGRGSSDQFLTCTGVFECGVGIDRLGSGGNRFMDGGGSNVLFTDACRVGISGALLYGPGAKPCACLFGGGSVL